MEKLNQAKVLAVGRADGSIQFFAHRDIDIKFILAPDVESSIEGELAAEEYIDLALPRCFRDLHYPGYIRETGFIRSLKPSEIAQGMADRELARGMANLHRDIKRNFTEVA